MRCKVSGEEYTPANVLLLLLLTGCHLLVVGGGAVAHHVLHLQELVGAVAADDGESKPLGALLQRRVVQLALQFAGVRREAERTALTCTQRAHACKVCVCVCVCVYVCVNDVPSVFFGGVVFPLEYDRFDSWKQAYLRTFK